MKIVLKDGTELPVNSVIVELNPDFLDVPELHADIRILKTIDKLVPVVTPANCAVITVHDDDGSTRTLEKFTKIKFLREEHYAGNEGTNTLLRLVIG